MEPNHSLWELHNSISVVNTLSGEVKPHRLRPSVAILLMRHILGKICVEKVVWRLSLKYLISFLGQCDWSESFGVHGISQLVSFTYQFSTWCVKLWEQEMKSEDIPILSVSLTCGGTHQQTDINSFNLSCNQLGKWLFLFLFNKG